MSPQQQQQQQHPAWIRWHFWFKCNNQKFPSFLPLWQSHFLFIYFFFYASSISKRCVSLQFIRAIGGLISCRRHLHLAAFLFLFSFFLIFMQQPRVGRPLPPPPQLSHKPLLHPRSTMSLVTCGERDRWAGPARPTEEQARFHLHGPHQTSASLLRSLKPL